ncbi:MAG: hypothetical protein PUC45_03310 [Oscillospiraceae bacterium]|nr:hypothetical protein [Oscillospiraceae bacterium]
MEELRRHLRPGEKLLWESAPEYFPLLEGKMMPRILGEWIITTGLAAWLLYVERDNPNFGTGIVCLVLLVAAAIIAAPLMEYYNLRKQAYYLTDQRAILMTGDKTFYYMDLDRIDAVEVIRGVADGGCIAMGGCILQEVRRQLRWQACHPRTDLQAADSSGEALGMVFYLPKRMDEVLHLIDKAGVGLAG